MKTKIFFYSFKLLHTFFFFSFLFVFAVFVAALLIKEICLALVNCTQFLLFVQNLRLNARCEWGNAIRLLYSLAYT